MGLWINHRLNQGVRIEREDKGIDVILRAVDGTKKSRGATLEVRGVPGKTSVHIHQSEGLVRLIEGIRMGIVYRVAHEGRRAMINYEAEGYKISHASHYD